MPDIERYRVPVEKLRWRCDPLSFDFDCTDELTPLREFVGQDRAIQALEFGLMVDKPGYNIFVTGLTGTGRASAIKAHLETIIAEKTKKKRGLGPDDWCYVLNFTDPDRPHILQLPKGKGKALRGHLEELLDQLRGEIAKAFSSEEHEARRKEIGEESQVQNRQLYHGLETEAHEGGFALQPSPVGLLLVPLIENHPASQEEFLALDQKVRKSIETKRVGLMKRMESTLQTVQTLEKETAGKLRDLDKALAERVIAGPFGDIAAKYKGFPQVVQYLDDTRAHTLDNIGLFREQEPQATPIPGAPITRERDPFLAFKVNVFVDNHDAHGPPIIIETNPTWGNMFGKIERRPHLGAYFTDHTMLKAGSMSLANGGYLVLNARDVLTNTGVWEGLKRVVKNKELRLEDPFEQMGFMVPQGLKPQAIPTDVKVVIIGDQSLYQLLSVYDEDTWEIFKVKADFDYQIGRTKDNLLAYAAFICGCCRTEGLTHFDRSAVARVAEHGARLVADQEKLSARFGQIKDLIIEADYWSKKDARGRVYGEHVQRALEAKDFRSSLLADRIRELIAEGTLMVDVDGAAPGQVNGLAVHDMGDFSFGRPSRITARTFMGRAGVINIERESQLSGRTHDKGVLILSGYLGSKFAQDKPLSLSASLCFEQSYDGIDGDSASSTELYATLSSLADVPLRQDTAVTGSVNQKGEVQPIGGVNQKIEGFFDVCQAKGSTGKQGVLIPHQNVKNLMLRDDVVEAVSQGRFHIYAVQSIDQGIEVLSGVEAGEKNGGDSYPPGTINYLVDRRLRELAEGLKGFSAPEAGAKK
ncbi:MAG: ATP-binding protein [Dehalococcoidia bacterium]